MSTKDKSQDQANESRRDFLKKAAYVPPVIVTLAAAPTAYAVGSVGQPESPPPPTGGPE